MIGFYNYTVILTYISLVSGFIGITQLFNNNFFVAVFCLLISGFCDMFDGTVARSAKNRTESEKSFGIQIDSLCDLVCFGVFPALFNYTYTKSINEKLSIVSLAIGVVFTLTALIRLGYFNVTEQERPLHPTQCFRRCWSAANSSIQMNLPRVCHRSSRKKPRFRQADI